MSGSLSRPDIPVFTAKPQWFNLISGSQPWQDRGSPSDRSAECLFILVIVITKSRHGNSLPSLDSFSERLCSVLSLFPPCVVVGVCVQPRTARGVFSCSLCMHSCLWSTWCGLQSSRHLRALAPLSPGFLLPVPSSLNETGAAAVTADVIAARHHRCYDNSKAQPLSFTGPFWLPLDSPNYALQHIKTLAANVKFAK